MREIKFKGKDKKTGEWVYGYFSKHYGDCLISSGSKDFWFVYCDSVGQFVGIKDMDGVDIYEGDIVRDGDGQLWVVFFDADCGWYRLKSYKNDGEQFVDDFPEHFSFDQRTSEKTGALLKIIGNVFDNGQGKEESKNTEHF